jgi:hypothetical protein
MAKKIKMTFESPLLNDISPHGEQKRSAKKSPEKVGRPAPSAVEGVPDHHLHKVPMPEYKPPSDAERMVGAAKEEKIHATREWVAGRMTTAKHGMVHSRANSIIKKHKGQKA